MCEALIDGLRFDAGGTATPLIRVPLTSADIPPILRVKRHSPRGGQRFAHVHQWWAILGLNQ